MPLIETKKLRFSWPDGSLALDGVDFRAERGERIALVGANGSGKSTLLLHLGGCLAPDSGTCLIEGVPADPEGERARRTVGLTWQDPDDQLFMPTVLEDVSFGLVARGVDHVEAARRALEQLSALGAAHLADRAPHRLSGGEKRIAAIAGVLVTKPKVLALDEPTASLDPKSRRRLIVLLSSLDATLVVATHDLDMALDVCDRAVVLRRGSVAGTGPLPAIFEDREFLARCDLEPPLRFGRDDCRPADFARKPIPRTD